ncbi:alpha/beta hydrolase (plasmid) [Sinorhizobium chiapasense]|uniref:alpha/beta hydrolase n=1 Tax=Sinorhizobium chiapasense TaxID=501572 RepID=UPI002FE3B846
MTISRFDEQVERFRHDVPIVFAFCDPGPDDPIAGLIASILPDAKVFSFNKGTRDTDPARPSRLSGAMPDMQAFAAHVEDLATVVTDKRRLYPGRAAYGIGCTTGATVLTALLIKHPDLFDRAALLHPLVAWTPPGNAGLAGKPVLVTGGQDDPARPLALTERLVDYLAGQKADVRALYNRGGHEIGPEEMMALREFLEEPIVRRGAGRVG